MLIREEFKPILFLLMLFVAGVAVGAVVYGVGGTAGMVTGLLSAGAVLAVVFIMILGSQLEDPPEGM